MRETLKEVTLELGHKGLIACLARRKGTGILAERRAFAKVWGVKEQVYLGKVVTQKMGLQDKLG